MMLLGTHVHAMNYLNILTNKSITVDNKGFCLLANHK